MTRHGLTLIELLIVIAVLSLLLQITLPAIEMSREAARSIQCSNNLRQLAVASHLHLDAQNHFPSGGWTHHWTGDPNRGFGKDQPGSWCYNLLPYSELGAIHDLGIGLPDVERRKLGAAMFATPIAGFTCPSRRPARAWTFIYSGKVVNSDDNGKAGRSDYAANIGNLTPCQQPDPGPMTLGEGTNWKEGDNPDSEWIRRTRYNGIVFQRSQITSAQITDGMSKTYLIGEKFMDPGYYKSGISPGDDQSMYVGFDRDNNRSGNSLHPPMRDKSMPLIWIPGDDERVIDWNFGSAHSTGYNMAFCDGSVRQIDYDISFELHSILSGRHDGERAAE